MALKKTVTTPHGIDVVDAYHRVEGLALGKRELSFCVRSYKTPDFPAFAAVGHSAPYDINGANPLAQAYAYLKSLPEFAGAVDC